MAIDIRVAPLAAPMLDFDLPADRWFLYGGRKTFKSYTFAMKAMLGALKWQSMGRTGTVLAARATQASLSESMLAECIRVMNDYPELGEQFTGGRKYLRTAEGRVNFVFRGTNVNPSSLKGVTGAFMGGIDEADECTEAGLQFFEPTIRTRAGEHPLGLHYLFNPSVEDTPCAKMFMQAIDGARGRTAEDNLYQSFICPDKRIGVIFGTYEDNPFLSQADLQFIQQKKLEMDTDDFANYYLGRFRRLSKSAYYARCLEEAEEEGRIIHGTIQYQLDLPTYICWDLGKNDMMAAVVCQVWKDFSDGRLKVSVLDYVTGVGEPVQYYAQMLIDRGYAQAVNYMPFDANQSRSYTENANNTAMRKLIEMGLKCQLVKNQGAAAAWDRIVKTRSIFRRLYIADWLNTKPLLTSLRLYAPKIINNLPTASPDHTYSDAADAFGLIAFVLEDCDNMQTHGDRSRTGQYTRHEAKWTDGL